ncbi:MAG: type II toxin-antitoxin system HicB family antitoxin [Firmicutes bacterium]|nr:type II toxin-antitoxin system HicB family antitoxin [Bacillota bacterium]
MISEWRWRFVEGPDIRYPVLLERLEYDGQVEYSATLPDLPGCVAAGDSPEEAVANVRAAIHRWLSDARQRGLPIPEPHRHSGRFTVRVPSWCTPNWIPWPSWTR